MQQQNQQFKSKAKQRCVMGVGMCLHAQLVQTKNLNASLACESFAYMFFSSLTHV